MLTADYMMNVAEPLVDLWSRVEDDIISDISRRMAKNAGKLTDTASWQVLKAREMGILQTDLSRSLARASAASQKQTYALIVDACKEALAFDDAIYIKAGYAPLPLAQSQALQQLIAAGIRKTNGLMRNFTNTTASAAELAFSNAMDRAWLQVNSGAFSYSEALRRAVRELGQQGIEKIAYPSGHVDRTDVAARRALLTGLNQTTAELQLARMDELETDLIEVSSHAGARPSHAEWQGQVYSKSGRDRHYQNFYDATGYGTGDGLCGWNCYHSFFPYFEGISRQAFERDPARRLGKSNDQVYEESQKQRYYERKIRDSRRECAALSGARDAATDAQAREALEAEFENAAAKLKSREKQLRDYCEQTGRTLEGDRISTYGYNRSVSGKTTWAAKRAAANAPSAAAKASGGAAASPTSGFKKIKGAHSVQQDLAAVNPNRAIGGVWRINCQRCCPTYEMRRRGFDVTAKPYGTRHDAAYIGWRNIFDKAIWRNAGASRTALCKDKVESLLKGWGDGARAEVYVQWKAGNAHVFMAENHGGVISFIDPQTNSMDASNYFNLIKPTKTEVCRLDQLAPTDLIKECCK